MNYYELLQIDKSASQAEIKKAYRKLAKQYHPDTVEGDESSFKEIVTAYEVLSDENRKRKYDIELGYRYSDNPFDSWFRNGEGSFSDMFNDAFGSSSKGRDVTVRMSITLEESYHGTQRRVDIGSTKLNVNIPKGVYEGMKLKISGKGQPHPVNSSAPKGDLILIINIKYDDRIILNGNDIYVDVDVSFYDMILGTEIEIKTPFYKIKVNVPPNSQNNKILRISGKGFPIYSMNTYGNLMVKLNAFNPPLKDSQIELIKKIKEIDNE